MAHNFSKFVNVNKKAEDKITVTKSSSIGFPSKFYSENKIEGFKYGVLFYDEQNKTIGIIFTNSEDEKSKFTIIKSKQGTPGGAVIARSFFKTYNIDPTKYAGKYNYGKENIEGYGEAFFIELKEKEEEIEPEKEQPVEMESTVDSPVT